MVSWHGFLLVYLVWGVLSFLILYVCVSCQVWEIFSHYFTEDSFSPTLFLSFWDSDDIHVWSFVRSLRFYSFFFLIYFLCSSSWVISIVLSSSLWILLFLVYSAVEPIHWDLHFCYCVCQEQPPYCQVIASSPLGLLWHHPSGCWGTLSRGEGVCLGSPFGLCWPVEGGATVFFCDVWMD